MLQLINQTIKHNASPHPPNYQNNPSTHQQHNQNNEYLQARWRVLRSTWIKSTMKKQNLVKLEWRRGGVVKNGQKLKKRVVFAYKNPYS